MSLGKLVQFQSRHTVLGGDFSLNLTGREIVGIEQTANPFRDQALSTGKVTGNGNDRHDQPLSLNGFADRALTDATADSRIERGGRVTCLQEFMLVSVLGSC